MSVCEGEGMHEKALSGIIDAMDVKLRELMPWDEYKKFIQRVAKAAFWVEINMMSECDFKSFLARHLDDILEDTDDDNS